MGIRNRLLKVSVGIAPVSIKVSYKVLRDCEGLDAKQ